MDFHIDEEKLDRSQRRIYNLPTELSGVVRGVAGSGKTNLALWRAKYLQTVEGNENYIVLIYTKALRKFIEAGLLEIGLNPDRVIHYDKWDKRPVDYIIVDETQDFPKERIENMKRNARKSIIFFGDNAQQLYEKGLKIDDVALLTEFPIYDLEFNYRMPLSVAKFAQYLNIENNNIVESCRNNISTTQPRLIKFGSWQEELDFIMNEIINRNLYGSGTESTAILLPFNLKGSVGTAPQHYSVESVEEYFKNKNFEVLCKKYDIVELDFNSNLPKIMTYHSAKGLQFDTVFIPHCGEDWAIYKNPLYVAMTRTSNRLVITYSDKLSKHIATVPSNIGLYETK